MINSPPRGLIANLVTPLTEQGRPDRAALAGLIRRLEPQAAAYLVGGVRVGEGLDLDFSDRLDLLTAAVGACQGRRAILFEITCPTADDTRLLLERVESTLEDLHPEAAVFYFLTPLVYHSNRDLPGHFRLLAGQSRRRFILSNNPRLVTGLRARMRHKNIRTSVLKKLAASEQLVGLEYDGDLSRAHNYQRAARLRSGFRFYDGDEANFIERPSSSGLISCGACLLPQAWADIVGSSLNIFDTQRLFPDHLSQIWQSGRAVRSLMAVYRTNPTAAIKAALRATGQIGTDRLKKDAVGLDPKQRERLVTILAELGLTG